MYSREEIEKVRSTVDIVEVIREYVPSLNVSGRSIKGLCPFHNEKTPSFHVQADKGFFKCFGCGEAGDVIAFVSKIEQVNFTEALERLAQQAGLVLKKERAASKPEVEGIREKLWRVLETAKNFYSHQLWDEKGGEPARAYLHGREIREETSRSFQLGVAPSSGDGVIEHLAKKNFPIDLCIQAGLATRSTGGRYYDPLYGRLIFPIFDNFGHVVGFGGRILPSAKRNIPGLTDVIEDSEAPKYINSPESPVFSKGKTLYGLDQAKAEILQQRRVVILEGYMDVIGLHQGGFKASVAALGTSLTRDHAKILKRYADQVVAFFDPDEAGQKATVRGLEPLLQESIYPRVVMAVGEKDPDEILLELGPDAFQKLLGDSPDFVDYMLTVSGVTRASGLDQRTRVAGELLSVIAQSPNEILKSEWAAKVAAGLGLVPEAIKKELSRTQLSKISETKTTAPGQTHRSVLTIEEEYLHLLFKMAAAGLSAELTAADFLEDREKHLFQFLKKEIEDKGTVSLPAIYDALPEPDRAWAGDLFMEDREFSDPAERRDQLIRSIKLNRNRERLGVLSEQIKKGIADRSVQDEFQTLLKRIKGSQGAVSANVVASQVENESRHPRGGGDPDRL